MIWLLVLAVLFWLGTWALNEWLSRRKFANPMQQRTVNLLIPLLFGVAILVLWEGFTRGLDVPRVLLPPPSMIWERIVNSLPILWADFQQTFLKAVIAGYVLGCGSGFIVALLCDRSLVPEARTAAAGQFCVGTCPSSVSRRSWSCGSALTGSRKRQWW